MLLLQPGDCELLGTMLCSLLGTHKGRASHDLEVSMKGSLSYGGRGGINPGLYTESLQPVVSMLRVSGEPVLRWNLHQLASSNSERRSLHLLCAGHASSAHKKENLVFRGLPRQVMNFIQATDWWDILHMRRVLHTWSQPCSAPPPRLRCPLACWLLLKA